MKINKIIILIMGILILGGGGYFGYKKGLFNKINVIKKKENEVEVIMKRISEVFLLPGEIPTVATISDKEKLKGQAFFDKAENGDKLLLFTNSNLAILYRDSIGKIVEISQISVANNPTIEMEPTTIPEEITIKVAILNGNGQAGMANKFEEEVVAKMENWQVIKKDNAKKLYDKTQIIDVNNSLGRTALTLASDLEGEVALLPEGEDKPEADLLIIVGKNWP